MPWRRAWRRLPAGGLVPAGWRRAFGAAPGHAVVAAARVLASVALAAAMAIMVASFRDSVDEWLGELLPADLYLRTSQAALSSGFLDAAQRARLAACAGVARGALHADGQPAPGGRASTGDLIARPGGGGRRRVAAGGRGGADRARTGDLTRRRWDRHGWRPGRGDAAAGRAGPVLRVGGVAGITRARPAR